MGHIDKHSPIWRGVICKLLVDRLVAFSLTTRWNSRYSFLSYFADVETTPQHLASSSEKTGIAESRSARIKLAVAGPTPWSASSVDIDVSQSGRAEKAAVVV